MCFCFVKQKTAYEMRISDWSSDVCSSDLILVLQQIENTYVEGVQRLRHCSGSPGREVEFYSIIQGVFDKKRTKFRGYRPRLVKTLSGIEEIGRASCRERVCQYG